MSVEICSETTYKVVIDLSKYSKEEVNIFWFKMLESDNTILKKAAKKGLNEVEPCHPSIAQYYLQQYLNGDLVLNGWFGGKWEIGEILDKEAANDIKAKINEFLGITNRPTLHECDYSEDVFEEKMELYCLEKLKLKEHALYKPLPILR